MDGGSYQFAETAEHFAQTINRLKGQTTMLFIAHLLPKGLLVDEVVRFGGAESVGQGSGGGATPERTVQSRNDEEK